MITSNFQSDVSVSDQPLAQAFQTVLAQAPVCLSTTPSGFQFSEYQAQNTNIELVVFSSISVSLLARIEQQCQLSLTALTAFNQRNQLESVRFAIECENITLAREQLVALTQSENFEAAIVTDAPRLDEPGLLVMDMDSTTIEIECIDEIAKLAGVGEKVAEVTELAMQGKLDFSQSLHQRVATLEDAPESILAAVANNLPLMAGLVTLVEALKTHNWRVAIASGGFTYFADHLKETLGLDAAYANTLEIVDEKLTGKVLGNVVDAQKKADVLVELAEQYGIKATQTVAMGDGANDLVMMGAAHLGVAYKAKPLVLAKADSSISHSGLDCMLHWLK
ncbi:phosphoserine phosphatase SerB [Thalassotalea montiporae]